MMKLAKTIGLVLALIVAVLVGLWANHLGLIARAVPPAPAVVTREHRIVTPVHLEVEGPHTCIRGETYVFLARFDTPGAVGRPVWRLIPEETGALEPIGDNGMAVRFRSLDSGVFSIICSVAGEGGQVANAHREFENTDLVEEVVEEVVQQPEPAMAAAPELPPQPPTVGELIRGAIDNVTSGDRTAEAKVVAGCFQSYIGRVNTGLVPPDSDVVVEVEKQVQAALGPRAANWNTFMAAVDNVVNSLREQGDVTTAASAVPTLAAVADALRQTR